MLAVVIAVILVVGASLFAQHKRRDPKKLFGVYSQIGKWFYLKYAVFLVLITLRRLKNKYFPNRKNGLDNKNEEFLERLQPLSNHEKAFDAVFFQAVNQEGYYVCTGLERRHKGKANGLFYLVVPGIGLLSSEKLPDTLLNADPVSLQNLKEYSAEGIRFAPAEPMKKWKVFFEGTMKKEGTSEKPVHVKLEGEWTSTLPFFLYDTDMSKRALARAIAKEPWTKDYFQTMKTVHQTHYEQLGKMTATLTLNGSEKRQLKLSAFRDHSFGHKRDWSLMHRYVFNMIYLENGMICIIGVVSHPCVSSQLEMGYVLQPDKQIHAVEYCNLQLYQHGENGRLPKNYGFSFMANGNTYDVDLVTEHEAVHYKGVDDEAKLVERFLRVQVNGIKGRAISEWHYNNVGK